MDDGEALKLLEDTRDKIDQIDDEIIELIVERTSLALEIATAKKVLKKDIKDTAREEYIQHKIKEIAKKNRINKVSLKQIMDILTDLSKHEQEKILRR